MEQAKFTSLSPNIMVDDVNATVRFYQKKLGFAILMTAPEKGDLNWAMVGRDQVTFMFQKRESFAGEYPSFAKHAVGGALTFFIKCENIDALYQTVKENNVKIVADMHDTPYGMKEFAIEDNNGFILAFAQDIV